MKQTEDCYRRTSKTVCKLIKFLYGLKEAPKSWHQKFDDIVLANGYKVNQSDQCVYRKLDNNDKRVMICLYVDDIVIFGTNLEQFVKTKEILSLSFSKKHIREVNVISVL